MTEWSDECPLIFRRADEHEITVAYDDVLFEQGGLGTDLAAITEDLTDPG